MTDHTILFKPEMVRALLDGRKTQTRRILNPQPPEWATFCQQPTMFNAFGRWVPSGLWAWSEPEQDPPRALRRWPIDKDGDHYWLRPKYSIRDRLWVKETWRPHSLGETNWNVEVEYAADGQRIIVNDGEFGDNDWHWPKAAERGNVSPLFMPRWASRITLPVTNVRVERVQDISKQDAIAEGLMKMPFANTIAQEMRCDWGFEGDNRHGSAVSAFATLWDSINAKPRPVKGDDGEVSHYVSYPWDGEPCTETYRGKPHHIHPNPWVAAYTFDVIKGNIDRTQQVAA